ncbi:CCAAT/enhancer-binding protein delta-like [Cloeon dipterum]|uniref:CCAAT/enhancer-binding protein delta-like n=1 Tax=Cloeon dipterum TaxID=197152 RepID=UPI0032208E27
MDQTLLNGQTDPMDQNPLMTVTSPMLDLSEMDDLSLFLDETLGSMCAPDNPHVASVPKAAQDDFELPPSRIYTDLSSARPNNDYNSPPAEYFALSSQTAPSPQQIYAPPPVAEFNFPVASTSFAVQNSEVRDEHVPRVRKRAVGGKGKIDKNSPEYKEYRLKNNVAVQKSRRKRALREQRMINQRDELKLRNDQMKFKISQMKKEVEALKHLCKRFNLCVPNFTPMQ